MAGYNYPRRVVLSGSADEEPLNEADLQCEPGKVGAAPTAGLVADAVKVRADGADAVVRLTGDLGVSTAMGDESDQFPFLCPQLVQAQRRLRFVRAGGGQQPGELGRGSQCHGRAALSGLPRPR